MGEPKPPMPLPQLMARRMGTARRLAAMFSSPTNCSMPTAMGQKMAATTVLGRKADRTTEALSQTKICWRSDVPMRQRVRSDMRRSSPVVVHARQMRSPPKSSTTMSVKYWAMTWALGMRVKAALTAMGRSDVTAMWTGRKIHQRAIQTAVPTASAPRCPQKTAEEYAGRRKSDGAGEEFRYGWFHGYGSLPSALKRIYQYGLSLIIYL